MSASGNAVIESGSEMSTDVSSTILVAVGGSDAPERAWSARRSVKWASRGGGGAVDARVTGSGGGAGASPPMEVWGARWVTAAQ